MKNTMTPLKDKEQAVGSISDHEDPQPQGFGWRGVWVKGHQQKVIMSTYASWRWTGFFLFHKIMFQIKT